MSKAIQIITSSIEPDIPPANRATCTTGVIAISKPDGTDTEYWWYSGDDTVLMSFATDMQTKGYTTFSKTVFSAPAPWVLWYPSAPLKRFATDHSNYANKIVTVVQHSDPSGTPAYVLAPCPTPPPVTASLAANIAPSGNQVNAISADAMVQILTAASNNGGGLSEDNLKSILSAVTGKFEKSMVTLVQAVNDKKGPSDKFPPLAKSAPELKREDKALFRLALAMWKGDSYFKGLDWDDDTSGTPEQRRKVAREVLLRVHKSYQFLFQNRPEINQNGIAMLQLIIAQLDPSAAHNIIRTLEALLALSQDGRPVAEYLNEARGLLMDLKDVQLEDIISVIVIIGADDVMHEGTYKAYVAGDPNVAKADLNGLEVIMCAEEGKQHGTKKHSGSACRADHSKDDKKTTTPSPQSNKSNKLVYPPKVTQKNKIPFCQALENVLKSPNICPTCFRTEERGKFCRDYGCSTAALQRGWVNVNGKWVKDIPKAQLIVDQYNTTFNMDLKIYGTSNAAARRVGTPPTQHEVVAPPSALVVPTAVAPPSALVVQQVVEPLSAPVIHSAHFPDEESSEIDEDEHDIADVVDEVGKDIVQNSARQASVPAANPDVDWDSGMGGCQLWDNVSDVGNY